MAKRIPSLLDNLYGRPLPMKKGEGILGAAPGHEEHFLHADEEPQRGFARRPIFVTPPRDMLPPRQARPLTPPPIAGRHHVEFSLASDPRSGAGLLGPAPGHEELFLHSADFSVRELPPARPGRALSPPPPLGLRPPPADHSRPPLLEHRAAARDRDERGEAGDPRPYERVAFDDGYVRQRQHFEYAHRPAAAAAAPSDGGAGDPYERDPYERDPYERDTYERDPYERDPYERDLYERDRDGYPPGADPYRATRPDPYERSAAAAADYRRSAFDQAPEVRNSRPGLLGAAPVGPLLPPPTLHPYAQSSLLGDPYMPRLVVPPKLPMLHGPQRAQQQRRRAGTRNNRSQSNAGASDKRSQPANGHGGTASQHSTRGGRGTGDSQKSAAGKSATDTPPEKKIKLEKSGGAQDSPKRHDDAAKSGDKDDNESSTEAGADGNDKNSSEKSLLTMTIQRGESSRAFKGGSPSQKHAEKSDAKEDSTPIKCHLCNITCSNSQQFKNHMNSTTHARCMQAVQQKSSMQVALLLAQDGSDSTGHGLSNTSPDLGQSASRWCTLCKEYMTCNLVQHRRSAAHKKAKRWTRPYCTVCKWNTRSVRKFVEHMSSESHREKAQLLQSGDAGKSGQSPGPTEDLITVDAVGCFQDGDEEDEEDDDDDDDDDEEEEGDDEETSSEHRAVKNKPRKSRRLSSDSSASHDGQEGKENYQEEKDDEVDDNKDEDKTEGSPTAKDTTAGSIVKGKVNKKVMRVGAKAVNMKYNPKVVYGEEYVVTVSGLLCHLCQKFYRAEPSARLAHCRSQAHFLKLQKHLRASSSAQTPQARGSGKEAPTTKVHDQPSGEKDPESTAGEPSEGDNPENAPSAGSGGVQEKDDPWVADHESTDEEAYYFEGLLAQDDDFGFAIGVETEEDLDDFPI